MTISPELAPTTDATEIAAKLVERTTSKLNEHIGDEWQWNPEQKVYTLENVSPAMRDRLARKLGEDGFRHQLIFDEATELSKLAMNQHQAEYSIGLASVKGCGFDLPKVIQPTLDSIPKLDTKWREEVLRAREYISEPQIK